MFRTASKSHALLAMAREAGADNVGQSRSAIATVMAVRPDMDAAEAHRLVEQVTCG